jgi:hypothetical protein
MLLSSARGVRPRHESPESRPQTASKVHRGPSWIPAGVRPHSPARQQMHVPMAGTRRNRAIEHTHLFKDNPALPPDDLSNFFWLYGAFDFKMQTSMELAHVNVFKIIDKLVEKMNKHAPQAVGGFEGIGSAPTGAGLSPRGGDSSAAPVPLKAHLIFDIISTKKHLGPIPEKGLPYQLGMDIYNYVEKAHSTQIVTSFVGLTDNTARRVGRDVYYTQSDTLSKNRMPFSIIDRVHMFVVFPPVAATSPAAPPAGGHDPTDQLRGQKTVVRTRKGSPRRGH